jgi:crotonobetainyl-CoA:carnitine CoA-transferase CaiB-like acyl-CoA transferase
MAEARAQAGGSAWLPLAGIRVVDFCMFLPGPFCSAILADLGAEVIKVEPIGGDPGRSYIPAQFRMDNRNKRSVAVNLKAPQARDVVERLAKHADIALEGFRPGVAQRLGIDYETLARANPRLIYCSLSGYGQTGPWRERPGHDVNYVAAAGGLAFPGQWLKAPVRPALAIADMGGGSFAAVAVLAALAERGKSGRGTRLDLSLFESAFFWSAMRHSLSHEADPKAHIFPSNDVFETQDGARVTLGILEQHFWENFARAVADVAPELSGERYASDVLRRRYGDELAQKLATLLRTRTADEWLRLCDANDVPVDVCLTPAQAAELEQIRERGDVVALGGERFALFPVHADGRRAGSIRFGVPGPGEHTREVLAEIGFRDDQIAALARSGAVRAG